MNELVDPNQLIAKGIESNVSVETMERLLAMRTQLKEESAREAFYAALSAFQSECPTIVKTKIVKGKGGDERYRFAPLEDIVKQVGPHLQNHGFSYTINTTPGDKELTAVIKIHHIQGHTETTEFKMPIEESAFMNKSQSAGSANSYAKRYAFINGFGLMTADQDDDGQSLGEGMSFQDLYRRFSIHMRAVLGNVDSVLTIKTGIATNELSQAAEAWFELDDDTKKALWLAPTKGGCFTTEEQKIIKSTEFRQAHYG